ncbi:MAG TPA: universal stress protein [Noviherbaspirillum sp.]
MYDKILIPTDGSELSAAAAQAGIEFARKNGSEVTGLYVAPEYQYPVSMEIIPPNYPSEEEYEAAMNKTGEGYLAEMRKAATEAGLKYTGIVAFSNRTAQKIVQVAGERDCDLIFIGSHGRGGLGQLLLGSVTAKVLSMCEIPVLVFRLKKR